jgi:hypothetical protein
MRYLGKKVGCQDDESMSRFLFQPKCKLKTFQQAMITLAKPKVRKVSLLPTFLFSSCNMSEQSRDLVHQFEKTNQNFAELWSNKAPLLQKPTKTVYIKSHKE